MRDSRTRHSSWTIVVLIPPAVVVDFLTAWQRFIDGHIPGPGHSTKLLSVVYRRETANGPREETIHVLTSGMSKTRLHHVIAADVESGLF